VLHNGEEVVKWEKVPSSWLEHKKHVIDVRERRGEKILHKSGVKAIAVIAGTESYGGKRGLQLEVEVDKANKDKIPDTVEGVSVKKVEPRERHDVTLPCYNESYSDLPGGAAVAKGSSTTSEFGSTGITVNLDGQFGTLSAYHLKSSGDIYGDYNGSSWQKVGSIYAANSKMDIIVITSSRVNQPDILEQSGSEHQGGYVTESGIGSRVSDPFDGYTQMGVTTGETVGGLGAYHVSSCPGSCSFATYHGHGVRGSADLAGGDSGGCGYSMHNGDAFVTHITTQSDEYKNTNNCINANRFNRAWGTAAYHINNQHWSVVGKSHS